MTGPLDALPWPNVIGKRCLDVSAPGGRIAEELERRGAAEIVTVDALAADPVAAAGPAVLGADLGRFDIAVCAGLLPRHRDPIAVLAAVRPLVDVLLLSVEPLDPVLTVVGRGRGLLTIDSAGLHPNGAAHRQLLLGAGWVIERVSAPLLLDAPDAPPPDRLGRLATRLLTRRSGPGVLHRAIVARPS